MDSEQTIATSGEAETIASQTLSNFFDDIIMTSNNGKEKIECFGCSG